MNNIQTALSSSKRIFELLGEDKESAENPTKTLPTELKGEIEFKNVSFGYEKGAPLMENGSIKEVGTHSELLAMDGLYADMYRNMAG